MLALTSDYITDAGTPEPYLQPLAAAGFSHLHWCHEWGSDYLYSDDEMRTAKQWLHENELDLIDLHASAGKMKDWTSGDEDVRQAGVELVKNRMRMATQLGGDVIVLHLHVEPPDGSAREMFWTQVRKSLDELEAYSRDQWPRIALENLLHDEYATLETVFEQYSPDFVGLCYDSGHGQIVEGGLDFLERTQERLISIHLHDNDSKSDIHKLPFSGDVDWGRLTKLIASSGYDRPITLETIITHTGINEADSFIQQASVEANVLANMIQSHRDEIHKDVE